ncbi:hypothetical protein A0H81_12568 [Grifola frondosa]|uniref:Uncharacterized protein n=1 Tax=Grifola frondosa TaxID=5627 RepID=A0A1C7LRL5_GRIFR|nr:hypothetical protein A0H81_12568 [Grifola frondosa]
MTTGSSHAHGPITLRRSDPHAAITQQFGLTNGNGAFSSICSHGIHMVSSTFQHDPPSYIIPLPIVLHVLQPPFLDAHAHSCSSAPLPYTIPLPVVLHVLHPPFLNIYAHSCPSAPTSLPVVSRVLHSRFLDADADADADTHSCPFTFFLVVLRVLPLLSSTPRPQLFTSAPLSSLTFSVVLLVFHPSLPRRR